MTSMQYMVGQNVSMRYW